MQGFFSSFLPLLKAHPEYFRGNISCGISKDCKWKWCRGWSLHLLQDVRSCRMMRVYWLPHCSVYLEHALIQSEWIVCTEATRVLRATSVLQSIYSALCNMFAFHLKQNRFIKAEHSVLPHVEHSLQHARRHWAADFEFTLDPRCWGCIHIYLYI